MTLRPHSISQSYGGIIALLRILCRFWHTIRWSGNMLAVAVIKNGDNCLPEKRWFRFGSFYSKQTNCFPCIFGGLDNLNAVSNSDMNSERIIISFFAFVRVVSSLAIGRQPLSSSRVMLTLWDNWWISIYVMGWCVEMSIIFIFISFVITPIMMTIDSACRRVS